MEGAVGFESQCRSFLLSCQGDSYYETSFYCEDKPNEITIEYWIGRIGNICRALSGTQKHKEKT